MLERSGRFGRECGREVRESKGKAINDGSRAYAGESKEEMVVQVRVRMEALK